MDNQIKEFIPYAVIGLLISLPIMVLLIVIQALQYDYDDDDYKPRYFVYFMLALVPAMINTTKSVNHSDLGYYYWLYNWASTQSLQTYITLIPKEPLYHIYNYLISIFTFSEFKLFVIISSLLMYVPVMVAFDIIVRKSDLDSRIAIYAAIILILFPQYFFYTMQIVRQVLAGSIAFYCIVKSIYYNNRLATIGVFLTGFIHASAFLFSFYYLFLITRSWNLTAKIVILTLCGVMFYAVLGFISSSTENGSTIAYAASRGLSENSDNITVGLFPRLICLSILPFGIFSAIKIKDYRFNTFVSVSWLIVGIMLLKWNSSLMVLRFMEYSYMYLPIVAVLFLTSYEKPKVIIPLALGMLAFFIISLPTSNFAYASLPSVIFRGIFMYFI